MSLEKFHTPFADAFRKIVVYYIMSKYHSFMREFNREKGYNSFYGSNKKEFQDAWQKSKTPSITPRPEVAKMEIITEPVIPKGDAAEKVLKNTDLLKIIGSYTNPRENRIRQEGRELRKKIIYRMDRLADFGDITIPTWFSGKSANYEKDQLTMPGIPNYDWMFDSDYPRTEINRKKAMEIIDDALLFRNKFEAKDVKNPFEEDDDYREDVLNYFLKDWKKYIFYAPYGYYKNKKPRRFAK